MGFSRSKIKTVSINVICYRLRLLQHNIVILIASLSTIHKQIRIPSDSETMRTFVFIPYDLCYNFFSRFRFLSLATSGRKICVIKKKRTNKQALYKGKRTEGLLTPQFNLLSLVSDGMTTYGDVMKNMKERVTVHNISQQKPAASSDITTFCQSVGLE